jgi:hypothetical protein
MASSEWFGTCDSAFRNNPIYSGTPRRSQQVALRRRAFGEPFDECRGGHRREPRLGPNSVDGNSVYFIEYLGGNALGKLLRRKLWGLSLTQKGSGNQSE